MFKWFIFRGDRSVADSLILNLGVNLHFPVISYLNAVFVVDPDPKIFELMGPRFENDKFITRANRERSMFDGWLLDHEGIFIELKANRKFRKWSWLNSIPSALFWLLQLFFYLEFEEYQVTNKEKITVKELKKIIKESPKTNHPWDTDYIEQFQSFITFLESQNELNVIDQQMLDVWLG